jgi:hypothetical protein
MLWSLPPPLPPGSRSHLEVWVREDELPNKAVVREAVASSSDGEHEDNGGGVKTVAGGQQTRSRLAHIDDAILHGFSGVHAVIWRAEL